MKYRLLLFAAVVIAVVVVAAAILTRTADPVGLPTALYSVDDLAPVNREFSESVSWSVYMEDGQIGQAYIDQPGGEITYSLLLAGGQSVGVWDVDTDGSDLEVHRVRLERFLAAVGGESGANAQAMSERMVEAASASHSYGCVWGVHEVQFYWSAVLSGWSTLFVPLPADAGVVMLPRC